MTWTRQTRRQPAAGSDMVPKYESKELEKSASEPNSLFDHGKKWSYNVYEDGFRVSVKKQSHHNCVNTTLACVGENEWYMVEDKVKLDKYALLR